MLQQEKLIYLKPNTFFLEKEIRELLFLHPADVVVFFAFIKSKIFRQFIR